MGDDARLRHGRGLVRRRGSSHQAAAPAAVKVDAPVKESALTTITLTPDAEKRLGIQTMTIERKTLQRTRTVGGEVVAPAGAERTVTAPFAGTLEVREACRPPARTSRPAHPSSG